MDSFFVKMSLDLLVGVGAGCLASWIVSLALHRDLQERRLALKKDKVSLKRKKLALKKAKIDQKLARQKYLNRSLRFDKPE